MRKNPVFILNTACLVMAVCLLWFLEGCSFEGIKESWPVTNSKEKVTVILPELTEPAWEISFWKIEITSCSKTVTKKLNGAEGRFNLELEKNRPVSVTVTPVFKKSESEEIEFIKPAGQIYPYGYNNGKLVLTWGGGYCSSVFKTLVTGAAEAGETAVYIQNYLSRFNWKRFLETIEEKINSSVKDFLDADDAASAVFYNPWLLNEQSVLEAIAYDSFNANKLRLSEVFSVDLELSCFSSFVPENEIIMEQKRVSVRKNEVNFFSLSQSYGIIVSGASAKNISIQCISMPIYKKEL